MNQPLLATLLAVPVGLSLGYLLAKFFDKFACTCPVNSAGCYKCGGC